MVISMAFRAVGEAGTTSLSADYWAPISRAVRVTFGDSVRSAHCAGASRFIESRGPVKRRR